MARVCRPREEWVCDAALDRFLSVELIKTRNSLPSAWRMLMPVFRGRSTGEGEGAKGN